MKVKNLILIFLLIPIITAIVLFHIKFLTQFKFKNFIHTLENKASQNSYTRNETNSDEIIEQFQKVFVKYTDSNGFSIAIPQYASLVILILTIIELSLLVIIQLQKTCCGCCKIFFSFIFIIHSLFDMLIYLGFANEQAEVKLEKEQIYSFDEEFNEEIKKNLDFMKERQIYLIACSYVAIVGIIVQFIIVILNMRDDCCHKNNNNYTNNVNVQQDVVVYTTENSNRVNNANLNNETDKRAI